MLTPDFDPPASAHVHRFIVKREDIDELGHAGNVSWVRWVNEAAIAHSQAMGLTVHVYRELGVLWVVRKHEIEYLASAQEDEALEATTWVADLRGATSLRRTLFHRATDRKLLSRAATTWALVEASTGRPRRVPRDLLQRYGFDG